MMDAIPNKWVIKERKKRGHETAPSYASQEIDDAIPINTGKHAKRFTNASRGLYTKTLRGVRK